MKLRLVSLILVLLVGTAHAQQGPSELLNVSYDPTREFYEAYNTEFARYWRSLKGQEVVVKQSHGGSAKQARAVIDGLQASVVTLALAFDIDAIAEKTKRIPANWETLLPSRSTPCYSTIIFLVRKGNPKAIRDWGDLVRPGIGVITPNPKTSGAARWSYLAAWAYSLRKGGGDDEAKKFVGALYKNAPVLDSGARGSTTTFVQRGIGDVLLSWENEAYLALEELGRDQFEVVVPSFSIRAEPPVAVVEENAKQQGVLEIARAYLEHLYAPESQELCAKHYLRPTLDAVMSKNESRFAKIELTSIDTLGGWKAAQERHFNDGGVFDEIYDASN